MERRHLKYATSDPNQPTSSSLTKDGGQTGGCLILGNTEEVPTLAFSGLLLTKAEARNRMEVFFLRTRGGRRSCGCREWRGRPEHRGGNRASGLIESSTRGHRRRQQCLCTRSVSQCAQLYCSTPYTIYSREYLLLY